MSLLALAIYFLAVLARLAQQGNLSIDDQMSPRAVIPILETFEEDAWILMRRGYRHPVSARVCEQALHRIPTGCLGGSGRR